MNLEDVNVEKELKIVFMGTPEFSVPVLEGLIENYKVTQEELSEAVGKSRPHITNTLRLLNLQSKIIKMIENGEITPGHGKALLRIEDTDKQLEIAKKLKKMNMSLSDIEKATGLTVEEIENL